MRARNCGVGCRASPTPFRQKANTIMTKKTKLSSLKANLTREREGDWEDSLKFPGVRYRVRALTYPAYRLARATLGKKLFKEYRGRDVPDDVMATEVGKLFAEHILLEWDGLDVPYSQDVALETLSEPEYREVVSDIEWAANSLATVEAETVEDAAKNSARPSATV